MLRYLLLFIQYIICFSPFFDHVNFVEFLHLLSIIIVLSVITFYYLYFIILPLSYLLSILQWSSYIIVGSFINIDIFTSIFFTSTQESISFLRSISFSKIINIAYASILIFIFLMVIEYLKNKVKNRHLKVSYIALLILFVLLVHLYSKNYNKYTKYEVIKSLLSFQKYLLNKQQKYQNTLIVDSSKKRQGTYILVRGESLSKRYTSLYGYHRITSPNMDKHEEQGNLIKFKNVMSPHVHTELVLRKIFSFNNNLSPDIIDLLKKI